jgi:hypothetical protein
MNNRMNLYKIGAAVLLTVAFNGCSTAGGPGAMALDVGGTVVAAAGGLAGDFIPIPFADVPFSLAASGMQMAADAKRDTAREGQSQAEQKARAGPTNGEAPVQLAGQASNGGNIQAGDNALPCETAAPVAYDGSAWQRAPCRQSDAD